MQFAFGRWRPKRVPSSKDLVDNQKHRVTPGGPRSRHFLLPKLRRSPFWFSIRGLSFCPSQIIMIVNDCTNLAHIEMVISFTLSYYSPNGWKISNSFVAWIPIFGYWNRKFSRYSTRPGWNLPAWALSVGGLRWIRAPWRRGITPKMLQISWDFEKIMV
jgi:hypothetical protein